MTDIQLAPLDRMSVADQIWALLVQVAIERVHRHLAATAAQFDLAPAQALALRELEADRPLSMRELAHRLKCDPSNITGLVDRLEARGLVERRAHPSDRRVKRLVLTREGARVREQVSAKLCCAPACVGALDAQDQERLRDLLLRILRESGPPPA